MAFENYGLDSQPSELRVRIPCIAPLWSVSTSILYFYFHFYLPTYATPNFFQGERKGKGWGEGDTLSRKIPAAIRHDDMAFIVDNYRRGQPAWNSPNFHMSIKERKP